MFQSRRAVAGPVLVIKIPCFYYPIIPAREPLAITSARILVRSTETMQLIALDIPIRILAIRQNHGYYCRWNSPRTSYSSFVPLTNIKKCDNKNDSTEKTVGWCIYEMFLHNFCFPKNLSLQLNASRMEVQSSVLGAPHYLCNMPDNIFFQRV